MLVEFKLWRLHADIREADQIIDDLNRFIKRRSFTEEETKKRSVLEALSSVPKIEFLDSYKGNKGAKRFIDEIGNEKEGIINCLKSAFADEEGVQARFGGIRFPPGVIINKIEHRIFNYDAVQDAVSQMVDKGELDCCAALVVRMKLKEKLHAMAEKIINMLDYPFQLTATQAINSRHALLQTNTRFLDRDIAKLQGEKTKAGCGDCGGTRSSSRWKPEPSTSTPRPTLNLTNRPEAPKPKPVFGGFRRGGYGTGAPVGGAFGNPGKKKKKY